MAAESMDADTIQGIGGKAINLVRLRDAGFPVPPFVVIDTSEYHQFVTDHQLAPVIDAALRRSPAQASATIRDAFRHPIRGEQKKRILALVEDLVASGPVAVRSSATAEDLPDASFAGQQDSFLDVDGTYAVLDAVVECWSSLWTERAIVYRAAIPGGETRPRADARAWGPSTSSGHGGASSGHGGTSSRNKGTNSRHGGTNSRHGRASSRNKGTNSQNEGTTSGHDSGAEPVEAQDDELAIAVVVQKMVPAEVAGVMFTADPVTGHRHITVIDAVPGLGEQLVSGAVVPDHFELDETGTVVRRSTRDDTPVLDAAQLCELMDLGRRIQDHFGRPQDVEFACAGGVLQVVQTRPITTLHPLPEPAPRQGVWFSFGAFQGMLQPITPLGQDLIRAAFGGAAQLFGREAIGIPAFIAPAGQRLWIRIDGILRTPVGRRAGVLLRNIDRNVGDVVQQLAAESARRPSFRRIRGMVRTIAPFAAKVVPGALAGLFRPRRTREKVQATGDLLVDEVVSRLADASRLTTPRTRLAARLDAMDWMGANAMPRLLPRMAPIMMLGVGMTVGLRRLAARTGLPDADQLALSVLRSLPGNVTVEMDLALWEVARTIRQDPESWRVLAHDQPDHLARRYLEGGLPDVAQSRIARFLEHYGTRAVAEIDVGVARWSEEPEPVLRTIISYLGLGDEDTPTAIHERGRHEAREAVETMARHSGPRAPLVRFAASRLRGFFGGRETAKFTLVRCIAAVRSALLASGADLMRADKLARADDVFFLQRTELAEAFALDHLVPLVARRRDTHRREQRRSRIPVVLAGDGRAFHGGSTSAGNMVGMGVSPGVVEGRARVVDDPGTSELQPGEILVCRGTDPAWTPLFLTAAGLVTEVGGLMTHGSVVAREYGMPAVVGVPDATALLRDGQLIRIDGSSGAITFVQ